MSFPIYYTSCLQKMVVKINLLIYFSRYGNNKVNAIIITEPHFSRDKNSQYHGNYHFVDPFNSQEDYAPVDPVHEQTPKHTAYVGRSISYENKSVIGGFTDEMLEWCRKHGLKRRKSYV